MTKITNHQKTQFAAEKIIPPGKVIAMAETMAPAEVARATGIDLEEVMTILGAAGRSKPKLAIRNRSTGQVVRGYTERGLYLKAQILGWVDWVYVSAEVA